MKIFLAKLLDILLTSILVTSLVRSVYLQDWLFVGLYIFILLSIKQYAETMKTVKTQQKIKDASKKMADLFKVDDKDE